MLIFGLKSNYFTKRFEKFEGGVYNEIEIELSKDFSFFLEYLCSSILIEAASRKLLCLRYLISFFEFGCDVEGSNAY